MPMPSPFKKVLLNHVFERCLKKADLLLVPTEKYKREFDALGFENVYYTPLGVDTELFNPSKRDFYLKKLLGVEESKFLLLYAGRLSVEKGIKTLLQAFELLDPSLFHLVVVGKGPLSFLVKWYAKRFNNLTYIPYLEKRELSVLYASADLFVSASSFETFGFAFLEAQASGTPVCAFDLELETQILKEFLSKERTPQALAQAIVKGTDLVSKSTRIYLRQRVEEDFSIFKNLERIISLYYSKIFARTYC
jgi:alpha-1,6-mannosyltransferase